jgi:predicted nucleotidyltransferase
LTVDSVTCLSALTERRLLPPDRCAVYLAGSLIRGWGNATSDLDVYVVTAAPWPGDVTTSSPVYVAPGALPVNAFYRADRRWDVEYWADSQVDELLDVVSWPAFDSGKALAATLTATEIAFIERLWFSSVVEGDDWLQRRRKQFHDSAIRTIVAARDLYALDHLTEDAVGMLASGDYDSAVLAARRALGFAVDALLASRGEIAGQSKWRARRMRAVAPPELGFDEYWELETMRSFDRQVPAQWVNSVLLVCQRIADAVRL